MGRSASTRLALTLWLAISAASAFALPTTTELAPEAGTESLESYIAEEVFDEYAYASTTMPPLPEVPEGNPQPQGDGEQEQEQEGESEGDIDTEEKDGEGDLEDPTFSPSPDRVISASDIIHLIQYLSMATQERSRLEVPLDDSLQAQEQEHASGHPQDNKLDQPEQRQQAEPDAQLTERAAEDILRVFLGVRRDGNDADSQGHANNRVRRDATPASALAPSAPLSANNDIEDGDGPAPIWEPELSKRDLIRWQHVLKDSSRLADLVNASPSRVRRRRHAYPHGSSSSMSGSSSSSSSSSSGGKSVSHSSTSSQSHGGGGGGSSSFSSSTSSSSSSSGGNFQGFPPFQGGFQQHQYSGPGGFGGAGGGGGFGGAGGGGDFGGAGGGGGFGGSGFGGSSFGYQPFPQQGFGYQPFPQSGFGNPGYQQNYGNSGFGGSGGGYGGFGGPGYGQQPEYGAGSGNSVSNSGSESNSGSGSYGTGMGSGSGQSGEDYNGSGLPEPDLEQGTDGAGMLDIRAGTPTRRCKTKNCAEENAIPTKSKAPAAAAARPVAAAPVSLGSRGSFGAAPQNAVSAPAPAAGNGNGCFATSSSSSNSQPPGPSVSLSDRGSLPGGGCFSSSSSSSSSGPPQGQGAPNPGHAQGPVSHGPAVAAGARLGAGPGAALSTRSAFASPALPAVASRSSPSRSQGSWSSSSSSIDSNGRGTQNSQSGKL